MTPPKDKTYEAGDIAIMRIGDVPVMVIARHSVANSDSVMYDVRAQGLGIYTVHDYELK